MFKTTVGLKIGAGFALAIALLIGSAAVSYTGIHGILEATDARKQTRQFLLDLQEFTTELARAELSQRDYLLSGSDGSLQPNQDARRRVEEKFRELRKIIDLSKSDGWNAALEALGLSAQSQTIGEIIATVDDFAAQPKLLAVNAAIEAAKAGEEGKGFAVVAQEVRSLAEQSKAATGQVRAILNDIRKSTGAVVLATEQGGKAVESGALQTNAAGASIGVLAANVSAAAHAVMQIAATIQEQAAGMDQAALAMENIKDASAQTVASTRQTESAAQQLRELSGKLQQLVERFRV